MSIKILLLEDDTLLAETLQDLLEEEGYEVLHSPNGQVALESTFDEKFNLYLLDINVPLIDGISLLKELRDADDNTPAIFLTSYTDKETLKNGFLNGGDDYITKPFDNEELLLRIKALINRTQTIKTKKVGDLVHDAMHKEILLKEKPLNLSKKEYELLALLIEHSPSPLTTEIILDELYSFSENGSLGAIRVYINRIKKISPDIKIENVRGLGYKLVS